MILDMDRMSCGNCGHSKMEVYAKDKRPELGIWIQCLHCESVTQVKPSEPKLRMGFPDEEGSGILSNGCLYFPRNPLD